MGGPSVPPGWAHIYAWATTVFGGTERNWSSDPGDVPENVALRCGCEYVRGSIHVETERQRDALLTAMIQITNQRSYVFVHPTVAAIAAEAVAKCEEGETQ